MVISVGLCSPTSSLVLRPGLCGLFYILEPLGHGDSQDLANIWIFSRTILREWFLVGDGKSSPLV